MFKLRPWRCDIIDKTDKKPGKSEIAEPPRLVYEDKPIYDLWLKLLLGGLLFLLLIIGYLRLSENVAEAATIFGVAAGIILLCLAILPRRYQIYSDRVRIVLGGPLAHNMPLDTIREVKAVWGYKAFAYGGLRFATSSKTPLEIVRRRGWSVVISPSDREAFIEQLQRVLPKKTDATKMEDDLFGLSKWFRF